MMTRRTLTQKMSLTTMVTKTWKRRVWIGMTWSVRRLQTIEEGREMMTRMHDLVESAAVRFYIILL